MEEQKTFIITVSQRDDLPDSQINEEYVRELLLLGSWINVVSVQEKTGDN